MSVTVNIDEMYFRGARIILSCPTGRTPVPYKSYFRSRLFYDYFGMDFAKFCFQFRSSAC